MSLAEELLADLDDLDDHQDEAQTDFKTPFLPVIKTTEDTVEKSKLSLKSLAKLYQSEKLTSVLSDIDKYSSAPISLNGSEDRFEYELVVTSNALSVEIDDEMALVHKHIRDVYATRFPELDSLVFNPLHYAAAIKIIGNDIEVSKYQDKLRSFLQSATVMVITVTSTTTKGVPLSDTDLGEVMESCTYLLHLDACRSKIFEFVQSRLVVIAPNLSAVIGSKCAAQLIGIAGGLLGLSRIPSCNIPSLGASKAALSGFSSSNPDLRNGAVYSSELISQVPSDFRKKAVKVVAGKIALSTRVDAAKEATDGAVGKQFRKEIDEKIEKWQEPPPTKDIKALEAPLEPPRKTRGGKRARKMKDMFAVTELQKLQNRVAFGVAEQEVMHFDESEGLGMLGQSIASGKVRASAIDVRVKAKIRQPIKRHSQSSQPASGLSSLIFTPVQGIELVDPEVKKQQLQAINDKWFASNAKFNPK